MACSLYHQVFMCQFQNNFNSVAELLQSQCNRHVTLPGFARILILPNVLITVHVLQAEAVPPPNTSNKPSITYLGLFRKLSHLKQQLCLNTKSSNIISALTLYVNININRIKYVYRQILTFFSHFHFLIFNNMMDA